VTGGSWELNTILESSKYRNNANVVKKNLTGVYAKGPNITLSPIYNNSGVVAYWKLDEGSGTNALDSSGNGKNGTWSGTGTIYHSPGKVGTYSGQFNGEDAADKISMPALGTFTAYTQIAWIYMRIIPTAPRERWDWFAFGSAQVGIDEYQTVARFHFPQGAGMVELNVGGLAAGEWIHIASTYSSSTGMGYAYINGSVGGSRNDVSGSTVSGTWPLGGDGYAVGYYFDGYIDDIRFYNRALSAAEIKAIYNSTR
jgi:hypothetical protein